jgi:hypothetical protein
MIKRNHASATDHAVSNQSATNSAVASPSRTALAQEKRVKSIITEPLICYNITIIRSSNEVNGNLSGECVEMFLPLPQEGADN